MANSAWQANFSTIDEKLKTLVSLIERHAYLPAENLSYNRNFVSLIEEAFLVLGRLGENAHCTTVGTNLRYGAIYFESSNLVYDEEKQARLVEELQVSFQFLSTFDIELKDLEQDLKKYKSLMTMRSDDVTKETNKLFHHFCKLSPLLYDSDGNAKVSCLDDAVLQIISTNGFDAENVYCDLFPLHLAPLITRMANSKGYGALHKVVRNTLNQFVPKVVQPAITLYAAGKQVVSKRSLAIEEVPPIYTPLRGALAGDCSMVSVPFYGLHKRVRTFWIRKSEDFEEKPAGYVIVAEIDRNGETVPYVITINGVTLKTIDCEMVFSLISNIYGANRIYISDLDENYYYVNTRVIAQAYSNAKGEKLTIDLPDGWNELGAVSSYEDYYRASRCCYVKEVAIDPSEGVEKFLDKTLVQGYEEPEEYSKVDVLARAVIYHYYSRTQCTEEELSQVQSKIDISDAQIIAISQLITVYREQSINPVQFTQLNKEFGFGLKEFSKFSLYVKAGVVRWLYDECKHLFAEPEWVTLINELNVELNKEIDADHYDPNLIDTLKDYKASLPDIYLPNYWQDIEPYLYLPNGYPNHYLSQRIVKHFHSVGTIEAFIEYLLKNDVVLTSLEADYERWADFFIRAKELLDNDASVHKAVEIAYVGQMKNTGKYHSPHYLAKALYYYEQIMGERFEGLKQELIDVRLTNEKDRKRFYESYDGISQKKAQK